MSIALGGADRILSGPYHAILKEENNVAPSASQSSSIEQPHKSIVVGYQHAGGARSTHENLYAVCDAVVAGAHPQTAQCHTNIV